MLIRVRLASDDDRGAKSARLKGTSV